MLQMLEGARKARRSTMLCAELAATEGVNFNAEEGDADCMAPLLANTTRAGQWRGRPSPIGRRTLKR